jgi:hypothetical protein
MNLLIIFIITIIFLSILFIILRKNKYENLEINNNINICKIDESQCPDNYYTCLEGPPIGGCSIQPWDENICPKQCQKKTIIPTDIRICNTDESQCPDNYYTCLEGAPIGGCSIQPWAENICPKQCKKSVSPPVPPPPTPEPSTPHPEKDIEIIIENNLNIKSYIFLRGIFNEIYLNKNMTKNIVNDKHYNCIGNKPKNIKLKNNQTIENCVPTINTLYFILDSKKHIKLYVKGNTNIISATVWSVPYNANNINSAGPFKQSQMEFTIDNNVVSYDLSFVEALSSGVKINYISEDNKNNISKCLPEKPNNLNIDNSLGFKTILSDKWTAKDINNFSSKYTDKMLAQCPSILSDNIEGQHECRRFYANSYDNPDSYCSWLKENNCQGYCWAMDEFVCNNKNCGWNYDNNINDRPNNVEQLYGEGLKRNYSKEYMDSIANIYSCGFYNPPNYDERLLGFWKNSGPGCIEKIIKNKPTNPQIIRNGGKLKIMFNNLDWLN